MNKITVAISSSPLLSGHKTRGMGFYTHQLISHLTNIPNLHIIKFQNQNPVNADIIHYPYFDLFYRSLPLIKAKPTVVTIGDVTPLIFPQHYPIGIKARLWLLQQQLSLKNTKAIITFSENSKKDLVNYLGIDPNKIFPIPLAAGSDFKIISDNLLLRSCQVRYNLPKSFALFIGNVNWNKNLLNVATACLKTPLDLVLIGKDFQEKPDLNHPELSSYADFLRQFSGERRIHRLGFIPQDDLVSIINLATVGLFPSYYEGFGLPVLEFQACGVPVVTSKISSLVEVAGGSALLVNPYGPFDISKAISSVLNNSRLRQELIEKGLANIKKFSWEKCAAQTFTIYKHYYGEPV